MSEDSSAVMAIDELSVTFRPFEDVREFFFARLRDLGIAMPAASDVHLVTVEWYHQLRRRIPARPRRVVRSPQLAARLLGPEDQRAISEIAAEVERGADLTRRLSRSINAPVAKTVADGSYDGLLTDWGIHHLHLSDVVEADGFVSRGKLLLFVLATDDTLYFLDVLPHGTKSFASHELFEIVHQNWPDVIASWRAPGFVPGSLSPKVREPAARRKMRQKFTMCVEAEDGTIYVPPGGGITTSGHSSIAVQEANGLLNTLRPCEEWVRSNLSWLVEQVTARSPVTLERFQLQYCVAPTVVTGEVTICETQSDVCFRPVPPARGGYPRIGRRSRT